jgi:hypothetical protein
MLHRIREVMQPGRENSVGTAKTPLKLMRHTSEAELETCTQSVVSLTRTATRKLL